MKIDLQTFEGIRCVLCPRVLAAALVLTMLVSGTQLGNVVQAQEESGGFKPLGFLSKDDKTRKSSFFDKKKEPLFKLPKFLSPDSEKGSSSSNTSMNNSKVVPAGFESDAKTTNRKKSMFGSARQSMSRGIGKLTNSTKRFWHSTADLLNPFDGRSMKKKKTNNNFLAYQGYQPQNEKPPKRGMFDWLIPPPAEPPPVDIGGFLRQPRPKF